MNLKGNGSCVGIAVPSLLVLTLLAVTRPAIAGDGTRLWRCELQGTITYSDTACAVAANKTEVASNRLNTFTENAESRPSTSKSETKTPPKRRGGSIAEEQMKHKQRCKEISDRLNALTDKIWRDDSTRKRRDQRQHLEDQQRKLEAERRAQQCH